MRSYELHAKTIVRTEAPDTCARITLLVPDAFNANDIDRALDRMRRDIKKMDTGQ